MYYLQKHINIYNIKTIKKNVPSLWFHFKIKTTDVHTDIDLNEFSEVKRENIIKYVKNLSLKRTRCRFYGKGLKSLDMVTTNMLLPLKKLSPSLEIESITSSLL